MKILIVEDEEALANGLKFNFEEEGYEVVTAGDGAQGLEFFRQNDPPFDLVVLDLMLPLMSGYETCRRIREIDNSVPILVLSARTLSEDRTQAFDVGTDQYMTKPFALPELLSRVRNLLERRGGQGSTRNVQPKLQAVHQIGKARVDLSTFQVTVGGKDETLTTTEAQLLQYFLQNEGRVLSRAEILENVWDQSADITTRTIDNFVMRLRRMIEVDAALPRHFVSVRGTGYRFVARPESVNG